jgi:Asp-tRNA(Asn)/Glu-tRNA(Gln) amidotransferase A subunit family amidase
MSSPHDRPTADELLESVREWLERDVAQVEDARIAFHARVAASIIEIVRRENVSSVDVDMRHDGLLRSLNVSGEQELVDKIRSGTYDDNLLEMLHKLRPVVEDKVAVANPKYLY